MEPRWRGLAANAVHSKGKAGCFGGLAEQRAAQLWGHPLTPIKAGGAQDKARGNEEKEKGRCGGRCMAGGDAAGKGQCVCCRPSATGSAGTRARGTAAGE